MTLTGISNRGLLLIAALVAMLWGIILAERAILRQARRESLELLRTRDRVPVKYQKPQFRRAPDRHFSG